MTARRLVIVSGVVAVAVSISALVSRAPLWVTIAFSSTAVLCCAYAIVQRDRKVDLFSPWVLYPLVYLLYYGVGWALPLDYVGGYLGADQWSYYLLGLACYVVGLVLAGARLGTLPATLSIRADSLAISGSRRRGIAVAAMGLASWAYAFVRFGLRSSDFEFRFAGTPGWLFFLLLLVGLGPMTLWMNAIGAGASRRRVVALGFGVVVAAGIVGTFGSRSPVAVILGMAVVILHYVVKRFDMSTVMAVVISGFMLVTLFGYYRVLADPVRSEYYTVNADAYGIPAEFAPLAPGLLSVRNGPGHLALIQNIYPHVEPYMSGAFSTMSILTVLPGEQPLPGHVLTTTLFGREVSDMGGVAPSVLGGFYVDGGALGIALGMLFTGFSLGLLYERMRSRPTALSVSVYAAVLVNYLLWIYGSFFTNPTILWMLLVLWFVLAPMSVRPTSESGEHA